MPLRDVLPASDALFDIHLFDIGGTPVTLLTLVVFALILLTTMLMSWLLRRALRGLFERRQVADRANAALVLRLLHYGTLLLGVAVGLHTVGINLSALFAAGALFAVAAGFAMQELGSNLAAGLTLLFERTIKPGDVLEVNDRLVRVETIGMRATVARTLDEEELILPNAELVKSTVTSYTYAAPLARIRVAVGVSYGSDMQRVRTVLEETAAAQPWRVARFEPVVLMIDFADSAVVWEASLCTDDPWRARRRAAELREAIWFAFAEAGITIAFPQVDVHLDPPVVESLRGLVAAS